MTKFKKYNIILIIIMIFISIFWINSGSDILSSLAATIVFYLTGLYIIYERDKASKEKKELNKDNAFSVGWINDNRLKANIISDSNQSDLNKFMEEYTLTLDKANLFNGMSDKDIIKKMKVNNKIFKLENTTIDSSIKLVRDKNNKEDKKAIKITSILNQGEELFLGYLDKKYVHDTRFKISKIKETKLSIDGGSYKSVILNKENEKEIVENNTPISLYLDITFE